MKKPVKSIQHKADKRAHIPSAEEAGYESGNTRVQKTPDPRIFSLNPIIHRGQDPELNWMDKYKPAELRVPVRSLYRHEHIAPEALIKGLYRIVEQKSDQGKLFTVDQLFGNATTHEELDKVSDYYTHSDGWTNRLIQGDSLHCMTSLLEREGMAGAVQCIYIDPPYGIKYGSNWQVRLNSRTVTDGQPGAHDSLKGRDPKTPLRGHNVRYGFVYKKVPHITLGSIANNEPAAEETLYDQPLEDKKRLRVAGPFTVETLQSYEPISPEELARQREDVEELGAFEDLIFEHLKSAGVKTGDKAEQAVFTRIDRLSSSELHAEGYYPAGGKEKKAYLHIGPKFGPVSKQAVNEAIKACRERRDADWLMILGFAFESGLSDVTTKDFGAFKVSIVRMHDDLLQEGLLKRDKKAASFVTIGEPDIRLHRKNGPPATATVEIAGLDIYDPIKDEVKSRDVHDIAYWMLDDDYDGSNFVVRQVFFCGGDKDEFDDWKKALSNIAAVKAKKTAEQTLKIELDDEAFAAAYGHTSRPFPIKPGQKVAVRVISQFGEETTKVLGANGGGKKK